MIFSQGETANIRPGYHVCESVSYWMEQCLWVSAISHVQCLWVSVILHGTMSVSQCYIEWYNVCVSVSYSMVKCVVRCVWVGTWYDGSVSYMCQLCVGGYMVRCVSVIYVSVSYSTSCHSIYDVCGWVHGTMGVSGYNVCASVSYRMAWCVWVGTMSVCQCGIEWYSVCVSVSYSMVQCVWVGKCLCARVI